MNKYYIDFLYYDGRYDSWDIDHWFCTADTEEEAVAKFVANHGKYSSDKIVKITTK